MESTSRAASCSTRLCILPTSTRPACEISNGRNTKQPQPQLLHHFLSLLLPDVPSLSPLFFKAISNTPYRTSNPTASSSPSTTTTTNNATIGPLFNQKPHKETSSHGLNPVGPIHHPHHLYPTDHFHRAGHPPHDCPPEPATVSHPARRRAGQGESSDPETGDGVDVEYVVEGMGG